MISANYQKTMTDLNQPKNKTKKILSEKINPEAKAILPKFSSEQAKEMVMKIAKMSCDPNQLLEKFGNDILPKLVNGTAQEKKEADKFLIENGGKLLSAWGFETQYPLTDANREEYRPLIIEATKQIIAEYECKAPSDKALAGILVNAYVEILTWTKKINSCYAAGEHISDERTRLLIFLSKELDRANRHFITALATLKQIKSPIIEFNVKAKTAFISQNQQVNAFTKNDLNQNENIEPK
jgi:hypothetical protein